MLRGENDVCSALNIPLASNDEVIGEQQGEGIHEMHKRKSMQMKIGNKMKY